jgi:adenylate cyclase
VLEIDRVKVKGKTEPETIYTLLGPAVLLHSAPFKRFAEQHGMMLAAYRDQNWDLALTLVDACRAGGAAAGLRLDGLYDAMRPGSQATAKARLQPTGSASTAP